MDKTLQRLTVLIGLYVITVAGANVSVGGSCLLNDPCTASGVENCQFSGEIQLILDNTTSELIVNEDVGDIIILVSLSEVLPQQFAANYRLVSGTASIDEDLSLDSEKDAAVQVLVFEAGQKSQRLQFTIKNDEIPELDETFLLIFMDSDCCVQVENNLTAKVVIVDNDRASEVATLTFDQLQYSCQENEGIIRIAVSLQPQQAVDCTVVYRVISYTACVGADVMGSESMQSVLIIAGETTANVSINIVDDVDEEEDEMFLVMLVGSNCINQPPAESIAVVEIIDDDEAMVSGDPHFTVPLLSGKTLCYGVQGYPGLAFNLVSNHHFVINALFIDDASQNDTDATWIGKLAIIPCNVDQAPVIIFDSFTETVTVKGQSDFKASVIRQISISGSSSVAVKFTKGISQHMSDPTVHVVYRHPMAAFSVTFHSNHLDVDWHIHDDYITQSHGLMGQFMGKGVEIDSTKSILIRPNFPPIPVVRSSYLSGKNHATNQCWKAMNTGSQGEGLIEGTILDYVVPNLIDKNFEFKRRL